MLYFITANRREVFSHRSDKLLEATVAIPNNEHSDIDNSVQEKSSI